MLSTMADVWAVDAADAVVRLDPKESTVAVGELVTLTANVVDAGADEVFEYRYSTPGNHGTLSTALETGNSLESSVQFVTYDAKSRGRA